MLSQVDLSLWFEKVGLTSEAQELINAIRGADPARLVRSAAGNVSGRYPSKKMGVTIQFESHRVELAIIFEMEHNPSVHEYYDQPNQIKLSYLLPETDAAPGQRKVTIRHIPDFFAIRTDCAGWEECKPEEELVRLAAKMPNRYVRDGDGRWRCPPGEEYAAQFGLYYRVRSSAEIDWIYQRNLLFLEDYLQADSPTISDQAMELVRQTVQAKPGLSLEEVLAHAARFSVDDVYQMIALEHIYVDLCDAPLATPDKVRVFLDRTIAQAFSRYLSSNVSTENTAKVVELKPGSLLTWAGQPWTVINMGDNKAFLQATDGTIVSLDFSQVSALVQRGDIQGVSVGGETTGSRAETIMMEASTADLAEATRRYNILAPHLFDYGQPTGSSDRSLRRWEQRYREAERRYGNGFVGLIPSVGQRGNRLSKLDNSTKALLDDFVVNKYETLKQQGKFAVYGFLVNACKKAGLEPPSYKTFTKAVDCRPQHEQIEKRSGRRAAYPNEPFYMELTMTTPRHGDRPFEIGHIDHTELDIELVCSETGQNLKRPWATFLVDAYSRRLLAFWIDFHAPSARSCMMVLRACVKRHNRLPKIIVVDGGPEFRGVYFETLLARYECLKKTRPGAEPRYGSVCERLFGTNNSQFIHNLTGNTQIMRRVRQVTKAVNPKTHALWTLPELYQAMEHWAYEYYDTREHPSLTQSPRDAFTVGMARSGNRPQRLIPYDREFLILTCPSTRKGTAKVQPAGRGVKINNVYYHSEAFRGIEGSLVEVKSNPLDTSLAYAYVGRQWVECRAEHYLKFLGRSEEQIHLASAELAKRLQNHNQKLTVRAAALADFLESVECQEALLVQRAKDREIRAVLDLLDGNTVRHVEADTISSPSAPDTSLPTTERAPSGTRKSVTVQEVF